MTSQIAWSAAANFWPRAETSRFVQVGNIDFHVQVSGAGEDVLLLHGAGASAHSFSGLAARLSEPGPGGEVTTHDHADAPYGVAFAVTFPPAAGRVGGSAACGCVDAGVGTSC